MGKLAGINISERRGIAKRPVESAELLEAHGLKGDAHAGNWHRQVSILGLENIERFREKGGKVDFGAFGENLIIEGFDLNSIPVETLIKVGETELKITQRGKDCHTHCAIYDMVGECIMQREGIFAEVIKGGTIQVGDPVEIEVPSYDRPFRAARITMSDKGSKGERVDTSGPLVDEMLRAAGYEMVEMILIPDEGELIEKELIRLSDQRQVDLIITTGGTGFSVRDVTPEATIKACDRMAPGISEAIRAYSLTKTIHGMLSRGVSGIRGRTLIINLPGSEKAVRESLEYILPALKHGLEVLRGSATECGSK